MDAALGPPEALVANRADLTPMMAQYLDVCERYGDALVLFHVGDFYKTFGEAAERVARLCELTLVEREDSSGSYAMAGIPVDNAESYVDRLLDAGYRVAVAEQVEDPEEVSGVAERAVTRVLTPGTLTEDELLDAENNFVACLTAGEGYGLAFLDVSTGDFVATTVDSRAALRDEVGRFDPAEAVVEPGAPEDVFDSGCALTPFDPDAFDRDRARERVASYFGSPDALLDADAEVRACGALLAYAEYARGGGDSLEYLNHLTRYDPREYMALDAVALRSLELFERRTVHGDESATLIEVLDETESALGGRELTDWLRRPLLDRDRIEGRLDGVEELRDRVTLRERIRDLLTGVYDLERLISRVSRGRANARDLRSLRATLELVPEAREALDDAAAPSLVSVREDLDGLDEIRDLIGRAIAADPPTELTEGGLIQPGYSDELDDLRETEREGKEWIEDLEASERERTGIDNLEVGYNAVHGYYIEVTDANLDRVPDDYTRRQTLKNAERFYTPDLKAREDEIIRAEGRADDLEYDLFCEVRDRVADETERVQALAGALARLDALASLAEVAARYDYVRPEIAEDGIEIRGGRHPVVERTQDSFVPNDARLSDAERFAIVTGPNMSGKSTYMRQVALIVVMAQVGSFVPASEARLRLVDRVFTRVGASDDIAGGRSTFMVEMTELAEILEGATERSLVLLDEVGRGTSTADGLAIARAITEYIHDEVGATTLFATHYHALTDMADRLDAAFNLHFDATRGDDGVTFEYDARRGPATASYGVDVARTAGVPEPVVRRAREHLEAGGDGDDAVASGGVDVSTYADAIEELRGIDVADTTPLEALERLADLKRRVE